MFGVIPDDDRSAINLGASNQGVEEIDALMVESLHLLQRNSNLINVSLPDDHPALSLKGCHNLKYLWHEYPRVCVLRIEIESGVLLALKFDGETNEPFLKELPSKEQHRQQMISPQQRECVEMLAWHYLGIGCSFIESSGDEKSTRKVRYSVPPSIKQLRQLLPSQSSDAEGNPSTVEFQHHGQTFANKELVSGHGNDFEISDLDDDPDIELAAIPDKTDFVLAGDIRGLRNFFTGAFEAIRQIPCKEIGKAFIEHLEPNQQMTHPHKTGKGQKKFDQQIPQNPLWWLSANREEDIMCFELDQRTKQERVAVLVHLVLLPATNLPLCDKTLNSANWQRKFLCTHDNSWIGLLKCAAKNASLRDGKRANLTAAQEKISQDRIDVRKEILEQVFVIAESMEQSARGGRDPDDRLTTKPFPMLPNQKNSKLKHGAANLVKAKKGKSTRQAISTLLPRGSATHDRTDEYNNEDSMVQSEFPGSTLALGPASIPFDVDVMDTEHSLEFSSTGAQEGTLAWHHSGVQECGTSRLNHQSPIHEQTNDQFEYENRLAVEPEPTVDFNKPSPMHLEDLGFTSAAHPLEQQSQEPYLLQELHLRPPDGMAFTDWLSTTEAHLAEQSVPSPVQCQGLAMPPRSIRTSHASRGRHLMKQQNMMQPNSLQPIMTQSGCPLWDDRIMPPTVRWNYDSVLTQPYWSFDGQSYHS